MIFIIKQKTHEKLHASNTNPPRKSQPTDIRSSQIGGGVGKRTGDLAWRNFTGIPVQVCMNRGKRTLEQSRAKSEKSVAKNNRIYRTL